jgi:hypothetical protein
MSVSQLPVRSVSSTLAGLVPPVDHVPHLGPDDLARTLWAPTPASVPTVPTALTLETLTLHAAQQGQLLHQWATALETRPALPTGLVATLMALADEAARRQAAARFLARTECGVQQRLHWPILTASETPATRPPP